MNTQLNQDRAAMFVRLTRDLYNYITILIFFIFILQTNYLPRRFEKYMA